MKRALVFAAGLRAAALLVVAAPSVSGCTGNSTAKAPEALTTQDAGAVLQDALVLSAVKATLIGDDPDSTTSVGVAVSAGVVTLRGTVKDAATRDRLVGAARRTTGVKTVVDDLRVDPHARRLSQEVGDVALAARVEAAITAQTGLQHVSVRVDRGVATLSGTVTDAKTKGTIVSTARGTTGIRNVVDRMRVGVP